MGKIILLKQEMLKATIVKARNVAIKTKKLGGKNSNIDQFDAENVP